LESAYPDPARGAGAGGAIFSPRAPKAFFAEVRIATAGGEMQFQHYDLGHLKRGSTVVVTLSGSRANVRLLDSSNFNGYRNGRQHRYLGGLATQSPVRLGVPSDGRWHVAGG
jgi:hypothetical protein